MIYKENFWLTYTGKKTDLQFYAYILCANFHGYETLMRFFWKKEHKNSFKKITRGL